MAETVPTKTLLGSAEFIKPLKLSSDGLTPGVDMAKASLAKLVMPSFNTVTSAELRPRDSAQLSKAAADSRMDVMAVKDRGEFQMK